ncbi:hypothetical protein LTR37_016024 [Vermiconidia calcicola]|uniref:Uncharacterized protein n=1 Tax=Vermiconidia calcicola TaxID=1690605 RepID=A0ACC3MQI4_9PEZI|nr:hypothetical protein LTR37_016024 [Vermiconidia calcicola]
MGITLSSRFCKFSERPDLWWCRRTQIIPRRVSSFGEAPPADACTHLSRDIAQDSNSDLVKGYSFVGLTQNLENPISDIASIPATYRWKPDNQTEYKGNVVFDFMTSDTRGDSTSSSAQELMLWLRYEGGQIPIGYNEGPVATINNLYGRTWKLYQGLNTDTGITFSSLLVDPDDQFHGWFKGDIKDWLLAMVDQGLFTASTYVNVGNAGMEPFYGNVTFENKVGVHINLA